MKEWEIWSEGYAATGEHSTAHFHGKAKGKTFDEACENFEYPEDIFKSYPLPGEDPVLIKKGEKLNLDKESDGSFRRGSFRGYIEPGVDRAEKMKGNYSIWACELFPTEAEARESFG